MVELMLLALALVAYAVVSSRLAMSPITAPMVFCGVGLIVGTAGLGWFDLAIESEAVSVLVEGTLVLVLFTDAARIDLSELRREAAVPTRLLGIGLPLSLLFGTVAAVVVFPSLSLVDAALLSAVLAPTDAALGQAVVSDRRLPVRIRQALNVESGLNDGIVVPVVTVLLVFAEAEQDNGGVWDVAHLIFRQIGGGLAVGLLAGGAGGLVLRRSVEANRVEGVYRQLGTIALAVAAFAGAELIEGNGFIAAFTAGLAFGKVAREQCAYLHDFTEDEGELLSVVTFTVFGAVLVGPLIDRLTWQIALYVVLSLAVVRVAAVVIAMSGSHTLFETRLFIGWFGPRGLASILFGLIVLEDLASPAASDIFAVAMWTILVSIFAHGASASPWAGRLSARIAASNRPMVETRPTPEIPTRRKIHQSMTQH